MRCKSFDSFFINFANKTRLEIILLLREKPLSVTEITDHLKEEQSKISHNLIKLTQCNILKVEQKGRQRIYSLNTNTVLPMLGLVEDHVKKNCCRGCNKQ